MRVRFLLTILILFLSFIFFGNTNADLGNIQLNVTVITPTATPTPTPTPTPTLTPTPTPTEESGGGGGGGGGGSVFVPPTVQKAELEFKGFAYPGAVIHVLKDGVEVGLTPGLDDTGEFTFVLKDVSAGTHNFGFWAQDKSGRRSITFPFQLTVSGGSVTKISNIVIPPTISLNKDSFSFDEDIIISGYSTPQKKVKLIVNSEPLEFFLDIFSEGDYRQILYSGGLEKGIHTTKSKTVILEDKIESMFSQLVSFGVGVSAPRVRCANNPDINKDGKINLIDFSIMAYWWKRALPLNSPVDLNGKLSLADFSILAFYWTG